MKNILLIGVGRFGRHIAMHLNQLGHQVMAVDRNEERIDAVMPYVTNAQIGDSVNADFLRSLGVGNYDVCIVTIGSSFQDSLETACLLKELGAKWVVSRAERDTGKIPVAERSGSGCLSGKTDGKMDSDSLQLGSCV